MFKFLSKLFGGAGEQSAPSPTEATPAPDVSKKADDLAEAAPAPEMSETPAVDAGPSEPVDAPETASVAADPEPVAPMAADPESAPAPEEDEGQSMTPPSGDVPRVVDASWHPNGAWIMLNIDAGEGVEPRFLKRMIHSEGPTSRLLAQADTLEELAGNRVKGATNETLDDSDPMQVMMVAARDALKAEAAE